MRLIAILILSLVFLAFLFVKYLKMELSVNETSRMVSPSVVNPPTPIVNSDKLFQITNTWRLENGYQSYEKSDTACTIASKRVPEVVNNFSHDDFYKYANDLPKGSFIAENLAEKYKSESEILLSWINSPSHLENLKKDYTHSCIKCSNTPENVCVHIFSYY